MRSGSVYSLAVERGRALTVDDPLGRSNTVEIRRSSERRTDGRRAPANAGAGASVARAAAAAAAASSAFRKPPTRSRSPST